MVMQRGGYIYIMTNKKNTTLYVGVTAFLRDRIYEHKSAIDLKSFTARYNLDKLVYYECFPFMEEAIAREKKLKGGSRKKKEELINALNPDWKDLYAEIQELN